MNRLFSWVSIGRSGPRVGVGLSRRFGGYGKGSTSPAVNTAANLILFICVLFGVAFMLWAG